MAIISAKSDLCDHKNPNHPVTDEDTEPSMDSLILVVFQVESAGMRPGRLLLTHTLSEST